MRFKFFASILVAALLVVPTTNSVAFLRMEQIPSVFAELTNAKTLANPAMVLVDINSGQIVYSRDANGLRKPASTLKLLSAFSILEYLPPESRFTTNVYRTDIANTFQIVGDFDPSITPSLKLAKNLKFVWSDNLVNQIRKVANSRSLKIRYFGITYRTKANMNSYFNKIGYRITWVGIKESETTEHITEPVVSAVSPELSKILNYTLLWSDNWVADYLAKTASAQAGYGYNADGIDLVFSDVLNKYEVNGPPVKAKDGSGLSHEDRASANTLVQVLLRMHSNPKFESAIKGLPVGGISGTLQNRFIKTAPQTVGLVRAKTGSLNGVVALAGYIESGEHQYAFAILADRLQRGYYAESAARATIDKILGRIAAPMIIVAQSMPSPEAEKAPEVNPTPSPESAAA
ncbi:MAG: D-alanyl-D-alanine carboxypeptidase [Candidatus Nanopelagicaceae bacterium]|jgi:D-alanyl-D-alanine carboxypeptidase/D-alanyl-D-alanine-endopeptidase (penicillin-binding protein 4)